MMLKGLDSERPHPFYDAIGRVAAQATKMDRSLEGLLQLAADSQFVGILVEASSTENLIKYGRATLSLFPDSERDVVEKLLKQADKANEDRNVIVHGVVQYVDFDRPELRAFGKSVLRSPRKVKGQVYTAQEVIDIALRLDRLTQAFMIIGHNIAAIRHKKGILTKWPGRVNSDILGQMEYYFNVPGDDESPHARDGSPVPPFYGEDHASKDHAAMRVTRVFPG